MISHSSRLPYHVFGTRRSSPDDLRCHRVVTYGVNMFQFNRFAISSTLDCVRCACGMHTEGALSLKVLASVSVSRLWGIQKWEVRAYKAGRTGDLDNLIFARRRHYGIH